MFKQIVSKVARMAHQVRGYNTALRSVPALRLNDGNIMPQLGLG